jgi:hypothetical protein
MPVKGSMCGSFGRVCYYEDNTKVVQNINQFCIGRVQWVGDISMATIVNHAQFINRHHNIVSN